MTQLTSSLVKVYKSCSFGMKASIDGFGCWQ